jgi:hypothetical protein
MGMEKVTLDDKLRHNIVPQLRHNISLKIILFYQSPNALGLGTNTVVFVIIVVVDTTGAQGGGQIGRHGGGQIGAQGNILKIRYYIGRV